VSVAVAHQVRSTGRAALREAAREAVFRDTHLAVLHVAESLDHDITEAYRAGISDEIERALGTADLGGLRWELHLAAGGAGGADVAATILRLSETVSAELLVIGGRRRSPVGKALMGSHTQNIILGARVPVLVMMPED
jgi:nucleotide-binding universal stress UspA family protein